ncbi:nuclear poly(A) polymerase 3 isoform X2 [Andrographis paniculata]|nr:nuclear poly(A) polymerase 3 isoform X2 [Andrographis paniculata]
MNSEGVVPTPDKEIKRRNAVDSLKKIVKQWVKRVAHRRGCPKSCIREASATILIYGSYGLGVDDHESDVDALCVGPCFATMDEDFFIVLRNMLASRPEVSELICVKDARVPLMRFNFDGVPIDLPYAKLSTVHIPENVDVLNPFFLANIDEVSWRSLSGLRVNKSILQFVPNIEVYQLLLRCVKFWAKRRGIYGHCFGFFGGVHLAVLAAFICWRHPNSQLSALVSIFFQTFAFWPWPAPVVLGEMMPSTQNHAVLERLLMPIQFPCSSSEYCYSNITRSTFNRIGKEFLRAHALTKGILQQQDFEWSLLFEPHVHAKEYQWFLKICVSTHRPDKLAEWVGWVKSRFRCLIIKLEELQWFCDPNPRELCAGGGGGTRPHVAFYWGLGRSGDEVDIKSIRSGFVKTVSNGYEGHIGMIELAVVAAAELPLRKNEGIIIIDGTKLACPPWALGGCGRSRWNDCLES